MADSEPDGKFGARRVLAAIAVIGGIALFLLSLFLPKLALSRTSWSPEQAQHYQDASAKLHALSHTAIHAQPDGRDAEAREKLQQAETEYKAIRSELDSATDRPAHVALALRLAGVGLLAIGAIGLYFGRTPPEA